MEVTIHNLSEVSREVEIEANAEELKPHFDKAYREYLPKIEIKGFRKGKAPLHLVKKLYGDLIEHESLNSIASEMYRQVVKERSLKPIGEPVLVDLDFKRGERFHFKIQYEVRPTIELKEYKGIPLERLVHSVTEEELEDEILRLQRINSTTEEVDRVTDSEHIVTAELQDVDEAGLPIIGKKTENARFYLSDEQLEQPFKNALKSAERGGEYRVRFEHQHGDHTHKVNIQVKATKVERVVLPKVDNAFVEKITKGKTTTVEAFKSGLYEDLVNYWQEKYRRQMTNSLVGEIVRRHDFDVPESLIRTVLDGLLEEIRDQYPKKQLPADFDTEKFYQENRAYAIFQAKWALLREEIIKGENIAVEESDLLAIAERESAKIGIDKERLINYYKSSDQVKDRIVGDKLIDLLIRSCKITEIEDARVQQNIVKG